MLTDEDLNDLDAAAHNGCRDIDPAAGIMNLVAEVRRLNLELMARDASDTGDSAYYRGSDAAFAVMCDQVNAILDGKDDGSGVTAEPWESTRRRIVVAVHALKTRTDQRDQAEKDAQHWANKVAGRIADDALYREATDKTIADLTAMNAGLADKNERLRAELAAERERVLAAVYDSDEPARVVVARLCDDVWDCSGVLLGRVRDAAYAAREGKPS